jgi:hypothetical protein
MITVAMVRGEYVLRRCERSVCCDGARGVCVAAVREECVLRRCEARCRSSSAERPARQVSHM